MEKTDADLIEATLAGDQAAYGEIVARYQKRIFRVALAVVRDPAEADVITQDTFVQAYLKLDRFEHRAELETWLTRIAINRSRDSLRGRKWVSLSSSEDDESPAIDPVDEHPDPERQVASRQLQKAIDKAVDGLSAQQRTIFRMRHFEEMPLEHIAELLGLRAGTVRAHLFRAVHKIRKELRHWFPDVKVTKESLG
jgi:RNA polymerase sigma-70 factor (ECF subfamily)